MFGGRKSDTGVAGRALEEVVTLLIVTQQVFRGEHGSVAGGAEDGRHG